MFAGVVVAALMQATAPTPGVIVEPDWQRVPGGDDIAKYYPKAATKEDLAGRAVISCTVTAEGRLADCKVTSEAPQGAGFGEAAVAMSEVFRMRPQTRDGQPVAGGTVRIPMTFIAPATFRTAGVRVRHPEVKGEIVEVDCRFTDQDVDNCFARGGAAANVKEIAVKLAEGITLPALPTKRRQGRIMLPLVFTDEGGDVQTPGVITQARWRERPSPGEVFRAAPEAARAKGLVGNVVVECAIGARGALNGCVVTTEDPAGEGFGAAALALAASYKHDEVDSFGLKAEGRKIRIPIRFPAAAPPTRGAEER